MGTACSLASTDIDEMLGKDWCLRRETTVSVLTTSSLLMRFLLLLLLAPVLRLADGDGYPAA